MTLNISGATTAIATRSSTVAPTMWTAEEIALREEHEACMEIAYLWRTRKAAR